MATRDGLKAYLHVPEFYQDDYPTPDELTEGLKEYGVTFGINQQILDRMYIERVCDKRILVAEGEPPGTGTDGYCKVLIDVSGIGKPKELEDGSVDHKDLKKVINVKKGQQLVRHIPPVPGKKGRSVLNKSIDPPKQKDVPLVSGVGTAISEEDPEVLVSATDGAVSLNARGTLEIKTAKVINGDIDYSTGNISFYGDLKIVGVVRAGFSVQADGDLYIGGNVEDAEVSSSQNIEITGGAVGSGNGKITCGGELKVHHLENFEITAGKDVSVDETILHSTVRTEGDVKAKTVIGGMIEAARGVEVETLGAASETKTIVKAGSVQFLLEQRKLLSGKVEDLHGQLSELKETIFALVKTGMDEMGKLSAPNTEKVEELKGQVHIKQKQFNGLNTRLEEVELKISDNPNPVIKVKQIFPNTVIRFGLAEKIISEKISNRIISADDNRIIVRQA